MSPVYFFYPILDKLNDGKVIRTALTLALRILGVLFLLGGLYFLIDLLKASFRLPTEGTIGGLIFAILFLAALLAVVQIFFYRAASIRDLGESPFTVIPMFSILFRAAGEVYATLGVAVGVGGCLFIWFSGISPLMLLGELGGLFPSSSAGNTFLSGVLFLVSLTVLSFVVLVVNYFVAEAIIVLVDIAKNIRLLVKQSGGTAQP
jgi:hypothetical protein